MVQAKLTLEIGQLRGVQMLSFPDFGAAMRQGLVPLAERINGSTGTSNGHAAGGMP
jgi:hypothetical protein